MVHCNHQNLVVIADYQKFDKQIPAPEKGGGDRRVGVMDLDRQLLPSQLVGANWCPDDRVVCGPQLVYRYTGKSDL